VVNSSLSFARNIILAEKSRLRSSQPRKAANRQAMKKLRFFSKDVVFDASILRFKAN